MLIFTHLWFISCYTYHIWCWASSLISILHHASSSTMHHDVLSWRATSIEAIEYPGNGDIQTSEHEESLSIQLSKRRSAHRRQTGAMRGANLHILDAWLGPWNYREDTWHIASYRVNEISWHNMYGSMRKPQLYVLRKSYHLRGAGGCVRQEPELLLRPPCAVVVTTAFFR